MTLASHVRFLREFITRPTMVGAVAPSSRRLSLEMVAGVDLGPASRTAEYGPGTGVFTCAILERLSPGARFFAVERNPGLVPGLRERFPALRLHEGSVEDIERFCAIEGINQLDTIVSGLPWASFPVGLQKRILDATLRVLRPGGRLITFGYHVGLMLPTGRRFAALLPTYFSSVSRSRGVWRNIPPAFVLRCTKAG